MTALHSPRIIDVPTLAERLRAGDRAALARAITLVESRKAEHQALARQLVQKLLPFTGTAMRVGVTGVPGVGKSTTIDTLGANLVAAGHKLAVLAVDPSSSRTGGSILGDKTRMTQLSVERNAFIRPSPSSGTLGGVAAKTRETMLLCEAAGFDVILVETVGIGQSETAVADMIAVNKSEGEGRNRAVLAAGEYRAALHIMQPASVHWSPPVVLISGLANAGLDEMWAQVVEHRRRFEVSGEGAKKRRDQQVKWMWTMLQERLFSRLRSDSTVRAMLPELEGQVAEGALSPTLAVEKIAAVLGL